MHIFQLKDNNMKSTSYTYFTYFDTESDNKT